MGITNADIVQHDTIVIHAPRNFHNKTGWLNLQKEFGNKYECMGVDEGACDDAAGGTVPGDKMTYIYAKERGFLMLSPPQKLSHNITTLFVTLPVSGGGCLGPPPLSWLIKRIVGYDTILINLFAKLFHSKGVLYKKHSRQIFVLHKHSSLKYTPSPLPVDVDYDLMDKIIDKVIVKSGIILTILFLFFTTTTLVSFILKQTQSKMLKFTFLLQYHVQHRIPYISLVFTHVLESLIFVPIMIGILFFLFEFYGDQLLAFLILSLVWISEVYALLR
jgi:hypothetical protein